MIKRGNIKKKHLIIIIVVIVFVIAVTTVLSVLLNTTCSVPVAELKGISAEPDYLIEIEWEKDKNAKSYLIEYYYELYPNKKYSLETEESHIFVNRIKGKLSFRLKALGAKGKKSSDFSEWEIFEVPALVLSTLYPFDFTHTQEGWKVDSNFSPVTYIYKGESKTVNFYEVSDNHNEGNTDYLSWVEIEDTIYNFPVGETIYRIRPVLHTYFKGQKVDDPDSIELYNLYEEVTPYVEIIHYNPE